MSPSENFLKDALQSPPPILRQVYATGSLPFKLAFSLGPSCIRLYGGRPQKATTVQI